MFWRWWKIVRGALVFTGFYLSGAVLGALLLPIVSLFHRDPIRRMRFNQYVVSIAFRMTLDVLRWNRLFTFNPRKVDPALPDHPVIVVVNHPTTIDVVATLSVYREASVVVKRKIWNDRLLRYLFRWCGHIDGGDGSMESNVALLDEIKARLAQGLSVVIFPEGTRSPVGGLGPMLKGAFAVASVTQTDILPVLITANPPALHKEAPWHVLPDRPVEYNVRPLGLLSAKGSSARKLQRQVTELFERELGLVRSEPVAAPAREEKLRDSHAYTPGL